MDRIAQSALGLAAIWMLLGGQEASVGPFEIPPLSPWWVVGALGSVLLLAPATDRRLGRARSIAGLAFLVSFPLLVSWRMEALSPRACLPVVVDGEREVRSGSLQILQRNELRRLTGERRNVELETSGLLEIPRTGRYAFDLFCDDYCEVSLGKHVLAVRGAHTELLDLARGEIPLRIRYVQTGGPARFQIRWNTPGVIELLPIDYFVRSPLGEPRNRTGAHLALAALASWCVLFSFYLLELARARRRWMASPWIPPALASIVIVYGTLLRLEALLSHSRAAERSEAAAELHERLLPFVPGYGIFNPAFAPEDPYRADVRSYLDRASVLTDEGFYAPSFREPFYVFLVWAFVRLAGQEIGILVESFVFSSLALLLFYWIAKRLHGPRWAVALLVPVALHEWLILEAPTGYRMSAYSFFLLGFAGIVAVSRPSAGRAAIAGLVGALLCLIRLTALAIVLPLLALKAIRLPRRESARYAAAFALVLVLLVGPFLGSNFRTHGDPFYSVSFHTQFWLRAEGLDESQGAVSVVRYFTDFGRTSQVVKGTLLGLTVLPVRTFWNGFRRFPLLGMVTLGLGIVGLLLVRRGETRFLTAAYLGHLLPFAYIQNFPSGEMPRFVMPAFFLLVLAIPEAAGGLARLRRVRGRFTPPSRAEDQASER